MMLRGAALAAVLTGSVLTGVAAASAPAGAAANPAITIRAIDREGKVVAVTASLQSLSAGRVDDTLSSARPTRVPRGTYNIAAWVWEPNGSAATLADREITITRSLTVTFDARKGHRIRFTVNDPTVTADCVEAEPFTPGIEAFDGWQCNAAAATYAVPGKLPPGWRLFLQADMVRPNVALSPVEYVFVRVISGSIPANLTFSNVKANLASDHVTVRALDPGGTAGVGFTPQSDTEFLPSSETGQSATPPFSIEFHFTPGYRWQSCAFWASFTCQSEGLNNLPVYTVHHYAQTFGSAVWSPSLVIADVTGRQLAAGNGDGRWLFVDPGFIEDSGGLPVTSNQAWLYEGSKLLAHSARGAVTVNNISSSSRWYRLRIVASRGPRATVSKSLIVNYSFQAHALPDGLSYSPDEFLPRIVPRFLSGTNAAPPGSRTLVPIWFGSGGVVPVAVHGVQVAASANGGRTWQALHVSGSGSQRTVTVANPGSAGYISLRVSATDASGTSISVVVFNAYRVS